MCTLGKHRLAADHVMHCITVPPGLDDLSQRIQELLEMSVMVAPPVRLNITAAVDHAAQVIALLRPFPPVTWNQQSHVPEQSASQQTIVAICLAGSTDQKPVNAVQTRQN